MAQKISIEFLGGKVQVCWNVLHLGIVQPEVIFIKRLRNLVQPEDRDAQERANNIMYGAHIVWAIWHGL